jgi:hypothetical protein
MSAGAVEFTGGPCPDCGGADSVRGGVCDLCLADLGEWKGVPDQPERAPGVAADGLRFSDVMEELRAVVELAGSADGGSGVQEAGRRAERLLDALRDQFLRDLGGPVVGPAGVATERS